MTPATAARGRALSLPALCCVALLASGACDAAVSTTRPSLSPGELIEIVYDNLPGNQSDWIAIAPRGAADDYYDEWFYTGGVRSGRYVFNGRDEGVYEVRVYHDWPEGAYVVQERAAVFVSDTSGDPLPAEMPAPGGRYAEAFGSLVAMELPQPRMPSPPPEPAEVRWSSSGQGTLYGPGRGAHNYRVHELDTTAFPGGGTLVIDLRIGNGLGWGSADLFGEEGALPSTGVPKGLASAWDLSPGAARRLTHTFASGQKFRLCFEGSWTSPQGASNTYSFSATVKPRVGPAAHTETPEAW